MRSFKAMKFLKWLLYIILIPLWLLMAIVWGIWQSFEIGYDVIFDESRMYEDKEGAEEI